MGEKGEPQLQALAAASDVWWKVVDVGNGSVREVAVWVPAGRRWFSCCIQLASTQGHLTQLQIMRASFPASAGPAVPAYHVLRSRLTSFLSLIPPHQVSTCGPRHATTNGHNTRITCQHMLCDAAVSWPGAFADGGYGWAAGASSYRWCSKSSAFTEPNFSEYSLITSMTRLHLCDLSSISEASDISSINPASIRIPRKR